MMKLDYCDLHIGKSQEWVKGYMALTELAWFSSFFKYEHSNAAIFRMLHLEKYSVNQWLSSSDTNPFLGAVTLDKNIGFAVRSDKSTTVTNTNKALVILTKDESRKQGYQISNCFPCFPHHQDYRFIHLVRFFTTYLNTEWVHENNQSADYKQVVVKYRNSQDGETIYHTIKELRQVVNCFRWGEKELIKVLTETFCCAVRPETYGLSYKQFILEILSVLEKGNQHQHFESIHSRGC